MTKERGSGENPLYRAYDSLLSVGERFNGVTQKFWGGVALTGFGVMVVLGPGAPAAAATAMELGSLGFAVDTAGNTTAKNERNRIKRKS